VLSSQNIDLPQRFAAFRNRPLMTLMFGHLMVDMYVGLLPVFYPLLIDRFAIDLKTVGLVSLAYTGVASLIQPLFGWIALLFAVGFGLALLLPEHELSRAKSGRDAAA
jgi:hypothetical protein